MKRVFTKMHGAGNDFILVDDSEGTWSRSPDFIAGICDRHLGVGGDGVIYLCRAGDDDVIRMDYYNSDGSGAVCGNGLRCAASFAYGKGLSGGKRKMTFLAGGNLLTAEVKDDKGTSIRTELLVTEPFRKYELENSEVVYKGGVGVPHLVKAVPDAERIDLCREGRRLRFHERFQPEGANVDFVFFEKKDRPAVVRTYERGVEDETLACGTGCASTAVVLHQFFGFPEKLSILSRGGDILEIEIMKECNILKGVFLTGPAVTVFEGELSQ